MKVIFTLCLAVSFVMIGAMLATAQCKTESKVLRHVVLFKFKESATPEDVKKVEAAFADLPGKVPLIKGYEWGKNNSPENLNQGLTHCFLLTFSSEKDRDAYLVHPDHKAFGKTLGPYLDKVTVVDYWTEK
jgi:hypothetical protein